jgi:hypothetical protein
MADESKKEARFDTGGGAETGAAREEVTNLLLA